MNEVVAIVLAAGQSKRMGAAKLLLPWGDTTVLGQVVDVLTSQTDMGTDDKADKRITDIVVITGGWRKKVEAEVAKLAKHYPARAIFNQTFAQGEMLSSIQVGLRNAKSSDGGALIVLGDQPQVQRRTVREVIRALEENEGHIIIPSYRMRRGHPILIPHRYWDEVMQMKAPQTLRDFLNAHADGIVYVEADASVLQDLDTPEDYRRAQGA